MYRSRCCGLLLVIVILVTLSDCGTKPDTGTLTMIIESSPSNLDPRVGLDSQSERIDSLLFDDLLERDDHFNVQPGLAERWDNPDPLTYIFHLHHGVKFHDGRALTSRDVKWTFDSILQGKIVSTKSAAYRYVDRIEAPDDYTVVFRMKQPFATLLWNVSDGAIGIVPYGSGTEIGAHPVGSGPFRFVSSEQDKNVVIVRNDDYWGKKAHLPRVQFIVVPDMTTRALELRKGSADLEINALIPDMVLALERNPKLELLRAPGSVLSYIAMNCRDPILRDPRVRQAVAYAIDLRPLLQYLNQGLARPAASVLPPESWAFNADVPHYDHNSERARQLLDEAGYPARDGIRFHLLMKTSTEESNRLMAAVLQQQLREVGIVLDVRTFEFATLFADITKGLFQLYPLRWIGGNEDPDIFEYVFDSDKFPPSGANRSFYSNPRLDRLIARGLEEINQRKRQQIYDEVQFILAQDLPYVTLWYQDNLMIHSKRVHNLSLNPSGNFDFLKTAEID